MLLGSQVDSIMMQKPCPDPRQGLQLQDSLFSTETPMSHQLMAKFCPSFLLNAIPNVTEKDSTVAVCDNPQLRSI